ncbi:MAG: hypothetical protein KDI03_14155, partial [Anaerolineae bacterium]|nr:hypothetical protein [Anaerolineae bacterium]
MRKNSNPRGRMAAQPLVALLLVLTTLLLPSAPPVLAEADSLGWVGLMYPTGSSSSIITAGGSFDVYIQVWKGGVTDTPGQGANITCMLYWAQVASFGGTWTNITSTPMSYHGDAGNNDEYKGTISPPAGLYEFTAFCTDTTDNQSLWQGDGNGHLTVNPSSVPLTPVDAKALRSDTQSIVRFS